MSVQKLERSLWEERDGGVEETRCCAQAQKAAQNVGDAGKKLLVFGRRGCRYRCTQKLMYLEM
jgi:hypothetical protein